FFTIGRAPPPTLSPYTTLFRSVTEVFNTLQIYLGSYYVNDFNKFGRTYSVRVQADAPFRARADDIRQLKVRSSSGEMVPLSALRSEEHTSELQSHLNLVCRLLL